MTEARRKTLKVKDMQRRVIGKAMSAARHGLKMRESAKQISVLKTEETELAKYEYFRQFKLPDWDKREVPQGLGHYYTRYNPETHEGEGWFGSADKPEYYFEDALVPEYCVQGGDQDSDELVLASRNCGIGEGCFWSEWR